MQIIGKIFIVVGLFVFISGQSLNAQGLGGLKTNVNKKLGGIKNGISNRINTNINASKKLGSKTLDNFGKKINIKSIKNKTGNFVGKYTDTRIGSKVESSRWRDTATFTGARKAVGIAAGTAVGVLGGSRDSSIKTMNVLGGVGNKDLAQGAFYQNPNQRGFSLNVNKAKPSQEQYFYKDQKSGNIIGTKVYTDDTAKQLTPEFMKLGR